METIYLAEKCVQAIIYCKEEKASRTKLGQKIRAALNEKRWDCGSKNNKRYDSTGLLSDK
jgi:hypothetical protein